MVRLLQKYKDQGNLPSCVIHCFCGTVEQAIKYLSMGCYIGLTGKESYSIYKRNLNEKNLIYPQFMTIVLFNVCRIFMEG